MQIKQQLEVIGKEAFLALFKKPLLFVYAFADKGSKKRSLANEAALTDPVTADAIEKVHAKFEGKGEAILEELTSQGYVSKKGVITSRFFPLSADTFALPSLSVSTQNKALYKYLSGHCTQFDSTIAKLELLRLRAEAAKLGVTFKICQITRNEKTTQAAAQAKEIEYASVEELEAPEALPKGVEKKSGTEESEETSSESEEEEDKDLDLDAGSEFKVGAGKYHILPTTGDGACGLHAMLGEQNGAWFQYKGKDPNAAVRKAFVDQLNKRFKEKEIQHAFYRLMTTLLKDYMPNRKVPYVKDIFSPMKAFIADLEKQIQGFKDETKKLMGEQKILIAETLALFESHAPLRAQFEAKTGLDFDFVKGAQIKEQRKIFQERWNKEIAPLVANTVLGPKLTANYTRIRDLNELDDFYFTSLSKSDVMKRYVEAVSHPKYYISELELDFAANLFNKNVQIYTFDKALTPLQPYLYDPKDKNVIVIFHKGEHFSRCRLTA